MGICGRPGTSVGDVSTGGRVADVQLVLEIAARQQSVPEMAMLLPEVMSSDVEVAIIAARHDTKTCTAQPPYATSVPDIA
eukprot:2238658-Rhodomonas_salina.4